MAPLIRACRRCYASADPQRPQWLKLSLGHFTHNNELESLRRILQESGMALVVENDQTDCGQLANHGNFKALLSN